MPVDASIALQAPQQPSYLQQLGSLYAIKGQQQDNQAKQLAIQDVQRQNQDRQTLGDAYRQNVKQGVDGSTFVDENGFQQQIAQTAPHLLPQVQQSFRDQHAAQLKLQGEQLSAVHAHVAGTAQDLQGVAVLPADQKQDGWTRIRNQRIAQGVLKPGSPDDPGAIYPGDDVVHQLMASALSTKDQIEAVQKQTDAHITAVRDQNTAAHQAAEEAQSAAELARQKAADAALSRYRSGELGVRGAEVAVSRGRLGVEQQRLQMDLNKNNFDQNGAVEAQAQQIAAGQLRPLSQGRNNPFNRAVMARVLEINPNYGDNVYSTVQSYQSADGKQAQQIKGVATMAEHLDRSFQNSKELGFTPTLGTGMQHGGTAGSYMQDVNFYTQEVGKLVAGGAITEGEGKRLTTGLTSAFQGTRDGTLTELAKLANGRVEALAQGYKNGTGRDFQPEKFFDDPTLDKMKRYGIIGGGKQGVAPTGDALSVVAPNGKTYKFPTPEAAAAFKAKAGIQ